MKKTLALLLSVLMIVSTITCIFTVTTAQAETAATELISNGDFENTTLNAVGANMDGLRGTKNLPALLNGKWYRATGGLSYAAYGDLSAYDAETDTATKATETEYAKYFTACSTVIAQPDDATNHIGRMNQTLIQAMNFNAEEETFVLKAKVKGNDAITQFLIGFVGLQTKDGTSAVESFYDKYNLEIIKTSGNFTATAGPKITVTLANPTEWTDMEILFKATKIADPAPTIDDLSILDTDFTMLHFYHGSLDLSSGDNGKNYRKQGMYVDDISIKGYVNPFGEAEIYKDGELAENTNEAAGVDYTINGVKTIGIAVGDTVVATPRYNSDGLVFAGWYSGDELVTREKELTFTVKSTDCYIPKFINKNLLTNTAGSFENYDAETSLLVPTNTTFPEEGTWGANKTAGYYGATYAGTIYDVNGTPYTQEAKNSPEGLTNAPVDVKTDYAYTGNNSLLVKNNYRTLSTAINVEKNTNYTLSYYAFAPNGKIMTASGIVTTLNIGRNGAGQPVDSEGNPVADLCKAVADFKDLFTLAKSAKLTFDGENWQKVTLNFNSGDFETLYFAIASEADAYFYIDDLCLVTEETANESVAIKVVDSDGVVLDSAKAANIYAKTAVIDDFDGSKVLSIDYENESGAYLFAGWYDTDNNLLSKDEFYDYKGDLANVYAKIISKNILDGSASFENYAAETSLLVPTNTTFPEEGTWGANKTTGYYGATYAGTIYDVNGTPYTQEAKNSPEELTYAPVNVKTDYAYTGNNSLLVKNNYRTLSTALNVEKNTNYTLSYYAFAPNGKIMTASGIVTTLNIGRTNGAGQPVDSEGNPVADLYKAVADFKPLFTLAKSAKLTFDGENWQKVTLNFNSGDFEKLYFAIASEADAYFYIDELSLVAEETAKTTPAAPDAPAVESVTTSSVTLVATAGYEYSMDGVIWQTSNVFEGLQAGTTYTFYQRVAETETAYASEASTAIVFTTKAEIVDIPGNINGEGAVDLDDVNALSQYLAGWNIAVNEDALDVNGDNEVNLKDLVLLAQFVAGWDVTLS